MYKIKYSKSYLIVKGEELWFSPPFSYKEYFLTKGKISYKRYKNLAAEKTSKLI